MSIKRKFSTLLLFAILSSHVYAGINLALHKKYTFSPKPNYKLCTDRFDTIQLTDGKRFGSSWDKESTVGWAHKSSSPEVTVDLGKVEWINEVRVHSIGGGAADVEFPRFIAVFVSDHGKSFEYAGAISITDSSVGDKYKSSRLFVIRDLEIKGRFVKVLTHPVGMYLFLDEIEIIQDLGKTTKTVDRSTRLLRLDAEKTRLKLDGKISTAIEIVKKKRTLLGGNFANSMISRLNNIAKKISLHTDVKLSLSSLQSLLRDVGIAQAAIYWRVYGKPYVIMAANPMEVLLEKQMLISEAVTRKQIDLQLWQCEYESAAINILNCSDDNLQVSAHVSSLIGPEGIIIESLKTFTLRRAVYVDGHKIGSIADALVLLNEHDFSIEPGGITQLWITVFNPKLTPGTYTATIVINAKRTDGENLPAEKLNVNIAVAPVRFDTNVALNTCVWAYPDLSGITRGRLREAVQDLFSHHTNVFVAHESSIPFPQKFVGTKSVVDYSKLDSLIEMSTYARKYLFYFNFNEQHRDYKRFGGWMSISWKKKFSSWLLDWVKHLKEIGIGYDKFAIYPFDETLCDEFYKLAKLIKQTDPKIRIYANSFGNNPADFARFKDMIDIWCLSDTDSVRYPERIKIIKNSGGEVWMYMTGGPGKAMHPYSYYRLMAWRAFRRGLTGVGFWVYADPYNDMKEWNDDVLKPMGPWGVVYDPAQSPTNNLSEDIIPSRRWQAWREGIEDYQYLYELQKMINLKKSVSPGEADRLQRLLNGQVNYVLQDTNDYERVYQARQHITRALTQHN